MTNNPPIHNESDNVAVLGLGRMGTALATALLAAGYRTTVWNRSEGKDGSLLELGAVRAATAEDAVLASPIAIVALSNYEAVRHTLGTSPEAYAGRTLVNLTTGSPDEARTMAAWAAEHGIRYLDGAMMAVPQTVATPDAFFLYSGSDAAFNLHRGVLDTLATSHYLGTDPAVAELWDLGLLGTGYAALAGFLHSLALLDTADVSPSQFVPLASQWLQGMIAFMTELAHEIESGDYTQGVSSIDLNRAAVGNLVLASRLQGLDSDVHTPLRGLLDRRAADGHGADSFSSLFEVMRRRA
ncbi:NAD(P)-binding domain-containing protein [Micromonospora sp. NPDC051296]|uniref:NAD(P)-dependent oxidoreductase n=1 Tax=Micromonospora sp. NPDC051296 TaxID=3155046 RepID=UPI00341EA71D